MDNEPTQELPVVPALASEQPPQEVPVDMSYERAPQNADIESAEVASPQPENNSEDTRMTNVDKSHVEALAYNNNPTDPYSAGRSAEHAGEKYELEVVAERAGKTKEEVSQMINDDIWASITYGRQILEHQLEFGEKLDFNQEAFLTICKIAEAAKELGSASVSANGVEFRFFDIRPLYIRGHDFGGKVKNAALDFEVTLSDHTENPNTEIWSASPYKNIHNMPSERNGTYTLIESVQDTGKFTEVKKESVKPLDKEDVKRLNGLAESIIATKQ